MASGPESSRRWVHDCSAVRMPRFGSHLGCTLRRPSIACVSEQCSAAMRYASVTPHDREMPSRQWTKTTAEGSARAALMKCTARRNCSWSSSLSKKTSSRRPSVRYCGAFSCPLKCSALRPQLTTWVTPWAWSSSRDRAARSFPRYNRRLTRVITRLGACRGGDRAAGLALMSSSGDGEVGKAKGEGRCCLQAGARAAPPPRFTAPCGAKGGDPAPQAAAIVAPSRCSVGDGRWNTGEQLGESFSLLLRLPR
mmetsp:Transcript_25605/g.85835  ORF Transcript_25605/g.85835 Transcript_25605/m.85835 type:complete len:252 (+) Transcript_25605:845-1600(+)